MSRDQNDVVCRRDDRRIKELTRRNQHSQKCKDPRRQCFYHKLNALPGLTLEHFYAEFGDPRCTVFEISFGKTAKLRLKPYPRDSVGVSNEKESRCLNGNSVESQGVMYY